MIIQKNVSQNRKEIHQNLSHGDVANNPWSSGKMCRKIGKKSTKISRTEILQITHDHPKKCVAKSERNPPKSLALTPSNQILYKPASHPAASTPLANRSLHALSASGCVGRRKHSGKGKPVKRLRLEFVMTPTTVLPEMT